MDTPVIALSLPSRPALQPIRLGRLPQRLVLSWIMSGGVITGGFFVTALLLTERLSTSMLLPATVTLFLLGSLGGFVHGSLLAYLGRPASFSRSDWKRSVLASLMWSVPAVTIGLVVAFWIGLTTAAIASGSVPTLIAVVVAWQLGAFICVWAAIEGWLATRNSFARWPDCRAGSIVILTVFTALAVAFLATKPEIWWTDWQVTGVGAVILALGATIWIATPVVVAGLHLIQRLAHRRDVPSAHASPT